MATDTDEMTRKINQLESITSIQERVKDEIKDKFISLIPDETFQAMVDAAVNEFMEDDFKRVVREELDVFARERIKELLQSSDYQSAWGPNGEEMTKAAGNIISDNITEIVQAALGGMVQGVIQDLRYKAQQY